MSDTGAVRRAAGEVFMIVVGVLIALAASDWQESRTERRSERDLLLELRTALEADLAALDDQMERYRRVESHVETLIAVMSSGVPYADSIDAYFGTLYGFVFPKLNRAGYESLKSQGLDLVSDDALRSQIAQVYEQSYSYLDDTLEAERMVILDLLRPYVLLHFKDLRFNLSATPLDYAYVSRDQEFLNLVDYRLQLVKQNHVPNLELAFPGMRALKASLDRVLDD